MNSYDSNQVKNYNLSNTESRASPSALAGLALLVTVAVADTARANPQDNNSKYLPLSGAGATYIKSNTCFDLSWYLNHIEFCKKLGFYPGTILESHPYHLPLLPATSGANLNQIYWDSLGPKVRVVVDAAAKNNPRSTASSVDHTAVGVIRSIAQAVESPAVQNVVDDAVKVGGEIVEHSGANNLAKKSSKIGGKVWYGILGLIGAVSGEAYRRRKK